MSQERLIMRTIRKFTMSVIVPSKAASHLTRQIQVCRQEPEQTLQPFEESLSRRGKVLYLERATKVDLAKFQVISIAAL